MTTIACRSRMTNPQSTIRNPQSRSAFTLMEMLIVMLIIAVLAALALTALQGAAEEARADRTRAIIAKLDQLIMQRWESYRTRALPIRLLPGTNPRAAAGIRLASLRETQRCELPERISDLCGPAELVDLGADDDLDVVVAGPELAQLVTPPALARTYRRKAAQTVNAGQPWTAANQGAECLYLIVSTMHDGDKNALDYFMPGEIGDVDSDGMREILDGWGRPIEFLRWAPGFTNAPGVDGKWGVAATDDDGNGTQDDFSELGAIGSDDVVNLTMQRTDLPDPFDPVKMDDGFSLRPLIYSSGPDKLFDMSVGVGGTPIYAHVGFGGIPNDPYTHISPPVGMPADTNGDGSASFADNITNHYSPPTSP